MRPRRRGRPRGRSPRRRRPVAGRSGSAGSGHRAGRRNPGPTAAGAARAGAGARLAPAGWARPGPPDPGRPDQPARKTGRRHPTRPAHPGPVPRARTAEPRDAAGRARRGSLAPGVLAARGPGLAAGAGAHAPVARRFCGLVPATGVSLYLSRAVWLTPCLVWSLVLATPGDRALVGLLPPGCAGTGRPGRPGTPGVVIAAVTAAAIFPPAVAAPGLVRVPGLFAVSAPVPVFRPVAVPGLVPVLPGVEPAPLVGRPGSGSRHRSLRSAGIGPGGTVRVRFAAFARTGRLAARVRVVAAPDSAAARLVARGTAVHVRPARLSRAGPPAGAAGPVTPAARLRAPVRSPESGEPGRASYVGEIIRGLRWVTGSDSLRCLFRR